MNLKAKFDAVHSGFVQGMDGFRMSDGTRLTCADDQFDINAAAQGQLPYLLIRNGSWTGEMWSPFETLIKLDVPGELKVTCPVSKPGEIMRLAMLDILFALSLIRGVPINKETGLVTPYSKESLKLSFDDKLEMLVDRGGPTITSFKVREDKNKNPFDIADLVFHFEFIVTHSPEEVLAHVSVVTTGINVLDTEKNTINWDRTNPISYPRPAAEDQRSQGGFISPDVQLEIDGHPVKASDPPIADIPFYIGGDPSKTVVSLRTEPRTKSLVHPATNQMIAIATYQDGGVRNVTAASTWGSSNVSAATVNTTGLVTTVAAGISNITATYNGASGVCAVTVS